MLMAPRTIKHFLGFVAMRAKHTFNFSSEHIIIGQSMNFMHLVEFLSVPFLFEFMELN